MRHRILYTDGRALSTVRGTQAGWSVFWGSNDDRNTGAKVTGLYTGERAELYAVQYAANRILKEAESRFDGFYTICTHSKYAEDATNTSDSIAAMYNKEIIQALQADLQSVRVREVVITAYYGYHEGAEQLARHYA